MERSLEEAYYCGLKHIGIATYSSGKVFVYLLNKGFSEALSRQAVDELISNGFIDDRKAAAKVIRGRSGKKQESRYYMGKRLEEAGIADSVIVSVIDSLPPDEETLKSLFMSVTGSMSREDMFKLASRRGYEFSLAVRVYELLNNDNLL
ncbi:MAG: RecX family transcriptional regulator [Clostridiales bacterium]|nr:RecX family transcriptional regulator [Clostridiales bacterium]